MPWVEIVLPGALLLAKFAIKLFVDRSATLADFISAILALPVDIIFLSASLLAGYTITVAPNAKEGMGLFIVCMTFALFVVVLWRRTDGLFTRDRYYATVSLAMLNYILSLGTLIYALGLLSGGVSK